jgi:viologen exporter family transport system permease protein
VADVARVYLRLVGARMRSQFQYRTSFALDFVGVFLVTFLDFAAILIIFQNVPQLGGWSVDEVALLYGISGLAFALTDLAVGDLDLLKLQIREGNFDLVLIRPRGTLLQVVTSEFQVRRFGRIAQAATIFVYALARLHVHWTVGRILIVPIAIVSSTVIFGAVWIAASCIVFWAVEGGEAANTFTYGGQFFSQYPINVYESWLRRLLAFVIPMAFVAYFPALYILDKPDPVGAPTWLQFCSPLIAVGACLVAGFVWRFAVRHYRSAGG